LKLDILVLGAHPDDAEIGCGGTIAKHVSLGYKVGILDLTRGELGTRGTPEVRALEAAAGAKILGVEIRENLGLKDGFFQNDVDHGKGADLAYDACFLAGLIKIETVDDDGVKQMAWRPKSVYHYVQSHYITPDFVVDISDFMDKKMEAVRAFKPQFYDPLSKEPETYVSSPRFLKLLEARAIEYGNTIGTSYGEGFTARRYPGVNSLFDIF